MEQYKSLGRTASENTHLNPAASGTRRRITNSWWWFRWMVCSIQSWRRLNPWWWGSEKWLLDDHRRIRLSSSRCTKSQIVHAERRNISYSNEVHRRYQNNTHTSLDVFLEKQIEDYWNVDGEKELSDAWTGFTRFIFLNERPPDGYTWSERRLTRKQNTSRPDDIWPDMWTRVSDAAKKVAKQRWAIEKPKLDNARQLRGIHFIETRRWRVQAHNQSRSKKVGSTDDSSDALQNTKKKQWEDPPQYWETQDKICLYCWWRRKHETKARRSSTQISPNQDRITEKGMNSMNHYSLVHKFIPMPQAMKLPDAKAAVEKDMGQIGENSGMAADKSQKQERCDRWSKV